MIGSDTKKLTAISLLQRVAAGEASLETSIADVVPELDVSAAPDFPAATVHDLLTHQGGIVDYIERTSSDDPDALETFTVGEFADSAYALAPPGIFWNYSNPNFSLAGLLDQRLGGAPWPELLTDGVLSPLGMARTVATRAEVDADHAAGHGLDFSGSSEMQVVELDDIWESGWTRPAGLVWSNSLDQARLARFLVEADAAVLPADLHAALTGAQVPVYPDIPNTAYGYGVMVGQGLSLGATYDVPVWSHGGNTLTHTSTFYVLPEQGFAISILSNGYGDDFTRSVAAAIDSLVTLPAPADVDGPEFDPDGVDALVGTYVDPNNVGRIVLTRDGDGLAVEAPRLDQYDVPYDDEMTPISTRVWRWGVQGQVVGLAFIDGPDGETYLRNRAFVATRAPGEALVGPPAGDLKAWARALERSVEPVPPLLRPAR